MSAVPKTTSKDRVRTSVLVVEDEESFIEALTIGLEREGFVVHVARDGAEAIEVFDDVEPDLVLLDVMLPKLSGIDVCRELRTRSDVAIIMVTAKSAEIDTVVGLEVGADDYVSKPYRMRELVARMRAVLRRKGVESQAPVAASTGSGTGVARGAGRARVGGQDDEVVTVGDISVDHQRHEVWIRGALVALPLKEFELLALLLENAGRVLTRDQLIDRVWGADYVGDTKTLDVHVKRLRAKVELDPSHPVHIVTIRGLGYKFEDQ
jgi:two-component system response regulator RegX3